MTKSIVFRSISVPSPEPRSSEVINRLQLIEKSSLRIRDVINQLLKIVEVKSTTYVEDTDMIDLDDSDENST